ncbi:hypothetical protein [Marinimicrobium alkaliphilum]|uniref:hypothetical protein n=1 Tax=Marinimicrobium alkaliphilum TaxID=2202654 RepID=UPI0013003E24|nr:hypothetical protein [Marinimicrobium alkaliphilum]
MKTFLGICVGTFLLLPNAMAHEDWPCTHDETERLRALESVAGAIAVLLQETEDRPFWVRELSEELANSLPEPIARDGVSISYKDSYPGSKNELSTSCILTSRSYGQVTSICSVRLDSETSECHIMEVVYEE